MVCAAIITLVLSPAKSWADALEDATGCDYETNPDMRLHYCSRAIASGELTTENLSRAFNHRGIAYKNKGDYDRAIQDYDQVIRLNPDLAVPFVNRGNAYA